MGHRSKVVGRKRSTLLPSLSRCNIDAKKFDRTRHKGRDFILQDILIVLSDEDNPQLLSCTLEKHKIAIVIRKDIRTAIHYLSTQTPAFLLLDIDLEGAEIFLDSIACRFYDPPPFLIVVSSFSSSIERAAVLERGADICLEKPIDAVEVLAVINVTLRRAVRLERKQLRLAPCINQGDLIIDPLRRSVTLKGRPIELTVKEFDVLYLLASYPGVVLSKEEIYTHIWNDDYKFATTSVSDHISSLRQKMGVSAKDKQYIQTVHGAGYRFASQ